MWSDVLELASLVIVTNDNGVEEEQLTKNEVFCNEKSVTGTEFYQSSQNGNVIKVVLEVKQVDYNKDQYVIYDGETYKIERTYKKNLEDIELHCSLHKGLV